MLLVRTADLYLAIFKAGTVASVTRESDFGQAVHAKSRSQNSASPGTSKVNDYSF